jgi:hypothetical protein
MNGRVSFCEGFVPVVVDFRNSFSNAPERAQKYNGVHGTCVFVCVCVSVRGDYES